MRQIPISLTEEQYQFLKQRSGKTGCSIGSIIRSLLTDYIESGGG
jgi:hypothetical protein